MKKLQLGAEPDFAERGLLATVAEIMGIASYQVPETLGRSDQRAATIVDGERSSGGVLPLCIL